MAVTYEKIATTTLGSVAASVTFSSISSAYTDLVLVAMPIKDNANSPYLRFNSDSGSNYSQTYLEGNGTAASSARGSNQSFGYINLNATPEVNGYIIVNLNNYSNTTTYKTYIANTGQSATAVDRVIGLWRNTAAISTILIASSNGGNYAAGSVFTLYGIKAA
jgi:hypothetical protein